MGFLRSNSGILGSSSGPLFVGPGTAIVFPQAAFSAQGTGTNRQFSNNSVQGTYPIVDYLWDFGDSSTSTQASPSHVFPSLGQTYTVSLTVTDTQGNQDQATAQVVIASQSQFDEDVNTMLGRMQGEATTQLANLGYQEDLTSVSSALLIADQAADGSFPTYQGSFPTAQNDAGAYFIENYIRAYLRKIAIDYLYGTYDATMQGNASARAAIWLGLKGWIDTVELYAHYDRGTWTPLKWWTPQAIGWVLSLMIDAYLANPLETADGETANSIWFRIFDYFAGVGRALNGGTGFYELVIDNSDRITDINMTGSPDNGAGGNAIGVNTTMFIMGVVIGKITGSSHVMDRCRQGIINAFSVSFGVYNYDMNNNGTDIQDYVGINPGFVLMAHNSGGGKNQTLRYGYSALNNSSQFLVYTAATEFFLPSENIETLVSMCETAYTYNLRAVSNWSTSGRFLLALSNGGSPGPFSVRVGVLRDIPNAWTTDIFNRLDFMEEYFRRALPVPPWEKAINAWSAGDLCIASGDYGGPGGTPRAEYSIYYQLGRGGNDTSIPTAVAALSPREQSPAEANINFGEGYGIICRGTTLDVNDYDSNFSQFEQLIASIPPIEGPHGTIYADTISGLPVGSSTPHTVNAGEDQVQGITDDLHFFIGNEFNRNLDWFTHRYKCAKLGVRLRDTHPTLTQFTHIIFEMAAGLVVDSAPPAALKHNIVYSFHRPITYNFGAGNATISPGTNRTEAFSNVSMGWIWQQTAADTGEYAYGRGTLIIGPYNLDLEVENVAENETNGGKFHVKIDHGSSPSSASSIFLTIPKCTQADLVELAANFGTYFEYVNTDNQQSIRFIPDDVAVGIVWNPNLDGGGLPQSVATIESGITIGFDDTAGFIAKPNTNGTDYDVAYARNRWRVVPAPENGGTLATTRAHITGKPIAVLEWAKNSRPIAHDEVNDPPQLIAGAHYTGDITQTTI